MADGAEPSGMAIPDPPENGMQIGGDQMVTVDMDEAEMLAGNDPQNSSGGSDGGFCAVAAPGASGAHGALLLGLAGVITALFGRRRRRG